jgi:hypothetical protein
MIVTGKVRVLLVVANLLEARPLLSKSVVRIATLLPRAQAKRFAAVRL